MTDEEVHRLAALLSADMKRQNGALEVRADGLSVFDDYDNKSYDMVALAEVASQFIGQPAPVAKSASERELSEYEAQDARAGFNLIRDYIEMRFGPVASLASQEGVLAIAGPLFVHEAAAILDALARVADRLDILEEVDRRAATVVDAVTGDDGGNLVGGKWVGGHGGLLTRDTIRAVDQLRRVRQNG